MSVGMLVAAIVMTLVVVVLGGLFLFAFVGSVWLMREEDLAKREASRESAKRAF